MMKVSKHSSGRLRRCTLTCLLFDRTQLVDLCMSSSSLFRSLDRKAYVDFRFLNAAHSEARLKITRKMLVRILTFYQVMPSFLDFLVLFGSHEHSREKRFSSFRAESILGDPTLSLDSLGRAGKHFQICYNLKGIAMRTEGGTLTATNVSWSTLQAAVHHQFDISQGCAVWMIARAGWDIKERIESMTGTGGRTEDREFRTAAQSFKSSLAVHLLLCHWSSENWRSHFQWLEDEVRDKVSKCSL